MINARNFFDKPTKKKIKKLLKTFLLATEMIAQLLG